MHCWGELHKTAACHCAWASVALLCCRRLVERGSTTSRKQPKDRNAMTAWARGSEPSQRLKRLQSRARKHRQVAGCCVHHICARGAHYFSEEAAQHDHEHRAAMDSSAPHGLRHGQGTWGRRTACLHAQAYALLHAVQFKGNASHCCIYIALSRHVCH